MIGGKDWADLAVVSAVALSVISLMLGIQGAQHGRSRRQIAGTIALIWGAVALTLVLAWQLEGHWGGALFDVQVAPEPELVSRSLSGSQAAVLGVVLVVTLASYIAAIMAVRRLTAHADGPPDTLTVITRDDADGEAQ